jgi:hypothetical protein
MVDLALSLPSLILFLAATDKGGDQPFRGLEGGSRPLV